jgi:phytoene dehydrogenase-like protein
MQKRGVYPLWNFVGRYFKDERLKQLFSFQSMYLGVSPMKLQPFASALVSYMETGIGYMVSKRRNV